MGQMRVRRTGPWVKISCPFSWVQFILRVGQGVGQAVDSHFGSHHFRRFCNKKAPKTEVFDAFWSCWADSNCRPHPYQVYPGPPSGGFGNSFVLSAGLVGGILTYPFHCFHPLISPCGSRCGSKLRSLLLQTILHSSYLTQDEINC